MNKVMLIGNLTRDPELSQTGTGISVCRFTIAVNRSFSSANGERETDFFNISAWRGLGENCSKYLSKGKKVCVVGSIQLRNYEDKDGVRRTSVDIVADDVEFLSAKSDDASGYSDGRPEKPDKGDKAPRQGKVKVSEMTPVDSEELPF